MVGCHKNADLRRLSNEITAKRLFGCRLHFRSDAFLIQTQNKCTRLKYYSVPTENLCLSEDVENIPIDLLLKETTSQITALDFVPSTSLGKIEDVKQFLISDNTLRVLLKGN